MSEKLPTPLPGHSSDLPAATFQGPGVAPPFESPDSEEEGGIRLDRVVAALLRFKWLLVTSLVVGSVSGFMTYQLVQPVYRVEGAIWVNIEERNPSMGGPIAQGAMLEETAWIDLMKSYAVLDPVVTELRLYLTVADEHRPLFDEFELASRFLPGTYDLAVSDDGGHWSLTNEAGIELEQGAPGNRVGEVLGFNWTPPREGLSPGTTIRFRVVNPRDAARQLSNQLQTEMDRQGNFIRLAHTGTNPELIASILQSVMEQHVRVAAELKGANQDELTVILFEQLGTVQLELEEAESQLESFRVQTITLPSEESAPISAGLQVTRDPVFQAFFNRRVEQDNILRDLEGLREILDSIPNGPVRVESFELIPSVRGSSQLETALQELTTARAQLRSYLQDFTEEYPPVRDLRRDIRELETLTLPSLTVSLIAELEARAADLQEDLDSRSADLQEIPPRAIEEARLERRVSIADALYVDLRRRYESARLAAASSIPDIRILDDTRVPSVPSSDQRILLAGVVFLAFLGLGIVTAIFMDHKDPRFRYVADISDDLGIEILGVVPRLRSGRSENATAVFEAFRDIRMRTEFAHGTARPIVLSITSPDTDEGKTFVSGNLAIAFAQLGHQTLIIDGDTRRGDLHELFDHERKPGLTNLLEGRVRNSVIRSTAYENLDLLPSGSRRTTSPELLSSGRMQQALAALKPRYDVIIVDSPPMSAGSDAFVLGAHTGNLILVMRSGATDKELAKGKMETFLRLPVRILGGILNDIDESDAAVGYYRHYAYYLPDYIPGDDEILEDEEEEGSSVEDDFSPGIIGS